MSDSIRYYNLKKYLFEEVSQRFRFAQQLTVFDFFCIIIWKANRSKSKIARRILKKHSSLDSAVTALTKEIASAPENKERLRVLIENCGFRLPMASAILTVLFPDDFTVYDGPRVHRP